MRTRSQAHDLIIQENGIDLDATIVAAGLNFSPQDLLQRLRNGTVTSRCETGVGEDEGRLRLTFFSNNRRLQLVADRNGAILQRRVLNFGEKPLPASAHKG